MVQGHFARFKGPGWKSIDDPGPVPGARVGAVRMLDLAAPAAAIGYGVGRIGCLLAGDGDYGINTTLPWGVHMAKDALVPPIPPTAGAADADLRTSVLAGGLLDALAVGQAGAGRWAG